jgi:nucleotide-binding universal stress UspA family protein
MQMKRIVIGTDFSAPSVAAAGWTARHFAAGAEVILVHVVSVPEPPRFLRGRFPAPDTLIGTARDGAEARLREMARSLGAERIRCEVRVGKPAEQLAEAARAYNADLVAVGRHGERPGVWGQLGSTADNLVRTATTPVLLATGVRDVRPRRVLVALDDSEVKDVLVDWAHLLAERFRARVTALHVVGSAVMTHVLAEPLAAVEGGREASGGAGSAREELRRDADRWVESLIAGGVAPDRVTCEVAFGEPGQEILAAAERDGAELVVVGSHGAGRTRRALVGSVASEVLRGARCPVLVVVPPTDEIAD